MTLKLAQVAWLSIKLTTDNCWMNIGTVIRRIRQEKKLTLEELAFQAGTDATNLSRIEREMQNPTPDLLEKISISLELPISSLYLMVEQNIEPYVNTSNPSELKQAKKRLDQFVTRFMLLDNKNQLLANEFLGAMLKSQEKSKD